MLYFKYLNTFTSHYAYLLYTIAYVYFRPTNSLSFFSLNVGALPKGPLKAETESERRSWTSLRSDESPPGPSVNVSGQDILGASECSSGRPLVRSLSSTREEDPESSTPVPYGIFWPHLLQHDCISCRCRSRRVGVHCATSAFRVPATPIVRHEASCESVCETFANVLLRRSFAPLIFLSPIVQDPIWWIHRGPVDSSSFFDPRYIWFLSQFISLYGLCTSCDLCELCTVANVFHWSCSEERASIF